MAKIFHFPQKLEFFNFKKTWILQKNIYDTHENFFCSLVHTLKARVTIILHCMNWHDCMQTKSWPPPCRPLPMGGGPGWNEGKGQGCLKTKNKVDSQRVQGKNLFFFRFQSPFARTKSTLLPGTSITKFSKASRDRNLYVTSLKKGQFCFSVTGLAILAALFLVEKLFCNFRLILQEFSLTIERQNCCFVEK